MNPEYAQEISILLNRTKDISYNLRRVVNYVNPSRSELAEISKELTAVEKRLYILISKVTEDIIVKARDEHVIERQRGVG